MAVNTASVTHSTAFSTFTIKSKSTISGDGTIRRVTVTKLSHLPTKLTHVVMPTRAQVAYLRAHLTNTDAMPLLAGTASIYLDGVFVSKTDLKYISPLEEFSLNLGVDHELDIKKSPLKTYVVI